MGDDPLVDALYRLIRTGELSPGQRVDQRVISELLGVSRTPLREALRALAIDGVLTRTPNAGYAVAKLSAEDLLQYYSLRAFLETQVLAALHWPSEEELDQLRRSNEDCRVAAEAGDLDQLMTANRAFHFGMFRWSTLTIMVNELERVWRVSDPYRALHLSNRERRSHVAIDHDRMIEAIESRDPARLIELQDAHRATSRMLLHDMLSHGRPQSLMGLPQSKAQLGVRISVA
ncbi:GntR family transcriptional regulator [Parafrankia sp. EUN1f]|uniref:GntR family transcriptional regulator n=1 Tax=Parafrankia sp. EUN1f TaxID=102897 RepID=UPI0001C473FE|nr:GntR family transcriptional regulator [Parafrankia sp. EUN1f]EFC86789.1 transcriptional regulator, GntR family [Parafrankia sp. EUN1f]